MLDKRLNTKLFIVLLLAVTAYITFVLTDNNKLKKITEIEEYSNLFKNPITEITLKQSHTLPQGIILSDKDSITRWEDYLLSIEIKKERHLTWSEINVNGGLPTARVKTTHDEFVFYFFSIDYPSKILIGNTVYSIKSNLSNPFTETFN